MVHLALTAELVLGEGTQVGQKLTYVFIQQLWLSGKKIKPKIEVSEHVLLMSMNFGKET